MDGAPSFMDEGDVDAARALVEESADGELFRYPGPWTPRLLSGHPARVR
jgi:hypothetical protein